MSKRRKKGKGIVPVKYQLPMAVVLALVFVALLGSTVKRVKAAKQRPAPTTDAVAAAPPPAEPTETGDTTARM